MFEPVPVTLLEPEDPLRRSALLAALTTAAVAAALTATTPASAVSAYNAQPAPERTEVGALVVQWDRDGDGTAEVVDWYCSGTMIDRNTFLTAAHCTTDWPAGTRFYVSLAQDVQAALDAATTPAAKAAVGVEGTAHTNPAYPGNSANSQDIAVIEFTDAQAATLAQRWPFTPATLPTAGQLDAVGSHTLDAASWQVTGYGTEEAKRGPGGHTHPGGGVRNKAPLGFNALNKTWVRLAMNESRGYGGACYGDSGGPNFVTLGGGLILAGTTITGDGPCYATNVAYRMDTPSARGFLAPFVDLP
ncbi:trypsin-like serine protease [Micromonospora narathiwatensis]|uniref:Trypsin n=1 Tax=Micromonospora narathiwatensis TaxID=299146 RepID=A0A1A9ADS4_9ACTN|nr:trypsin-like serine protease [Micromonospora narathiwatensis]SBT54347.1 Trypsin [Micromonospora narathiwatensis]